MYKILVVENNTNDKEKILHLIEQSGIKCEVIEFNSGADAVLYIRDNDADVLITDIDVTDLDGTAIIEKVNRMDKSVKIIVVSDKDEYKYIRQGIKFSVYDYILKSNLAMDLADAILNAASAIGKDMMYASLKNKEKEYIMEHILHMAISGANLNDIKAYGNGRDSMKFLNEYHCLVLVDFNSDFFGKNGSDFKERFINDKDEYTYLNLNTHQSLFFYKDPKADYVKKAEGLIGRVFVKYGEKCFAAVSSLFEGYENMSKAMEELDLLIENKFYYKPGEVFYKGMSIDSADAVTIEDDTIMKQMKQALKMKNTKGLRMHFENFCHKYRNKTNFSQVYIKFLFANLLKEFNQSIPGMDEIVLNEEVDSLYKAADFNTVIQVVNESIDRLEMNFSQNPQMMHREVEVVKQYIYSNYGEEISVDKLADLVYMAPSYLSSVFKKETGQNLNKFIKSYRMERAKDMLENTIYKIMDISVMCGYPNVSYFCSSFREYYGVSPQKFRENGEENFDDDLVKY